MLCRCDSKTSHIPCHCPFCASTHTTPNSILHLHLLFSFAAAKTKNAGILPYVQPEIEEAMIIYVPGGEAR